MTFTTRDLYTQALELQRQRCEVYHQWDTSFHRALAGESSTLDLERTIQEAIVPAFQRVSTTLRELQAAVDPARRKEDSAIAFFADWVDRIQKAEAEHYKASVELASSIAQHCAVNTTAVAAAATTTKPTTMDKEEKEKEKEEPPPSATAATPPPPPPPGRAWGASVHDQDHCAISEVVPPASTQQLRFVRCPSVDLLGATDEADATLTEEEDAERVELASGEDRASYCPASVVNNCLEWSVRVKQLKEKKMRCQRLAADLYEELQCELSDADGFQ